MPKRSRSSSWRSALCFLSLVADQRAAGFTTVPCRTHPARNFAAPTVFFAGAPKEDMGDNMFRGFTRWLAQLSLEDYQWRSDVFKTNQADRMVEESLARMRGENATYVRPMDAGAALGPLGRWERESVNWLQSVFDEEGRRARKIVENAGKLVRPSENREDDHLHGLGPLGRLEKQVVEFFTQIRSSEWMRVQTNTLRPKDLDDNFRGPLGNFELKVVAALDEIRASEELRYEQSKIRGGQIVRPIDVPGPLGELELKVAALFQAEQRRARERQSRGRIVRPKDAGYRGPLGNAESNVFETFESLRQEEMERLRNIQKTIQEQRPMENDRDSLLGVTEALFVGILRAPELLMSVVSRVTELLQSENLAESDEQIMRRQEENEKKKKRG